MPAEHVVIPVFDGVQPLDVTGPHEVPMGATTLLDPRSRPRVRRVGGVAQQPGPVTGESGLKFVPAGLLPQTGRIGTLLVPGGPGALTAAHDEAFVAWLRCAAARSARREYAQSRA